MQYSVIHEEAPGTLIRRVNEAIKEGWIPQGGITIACTGTLEIFRVVWAQAMIKPEKENAE